MTGAVHKRMLLSSYCLLLLYQILWWPLAALAQGWLHLHVWEHTAEGPQDHCQAGHGLLQVRRGNDKCCAWELKSIHRIVDSLPEHDLLIFTGPIDAYFASKGLPKLEYRSATLKWLNPWDYSNIITESPNIYTTGAFIGRKNTWSQQQSSSSQPGL